MTVRLKLRPDHLAELALVRDVGPKKIDAVCIALSDLGQQLLEPHALRASIAQALAEEPEPARALSSQVLSLSMLARRERLTPQQVVDGLTESLTGASTDKGWDEAEVDRWRAIAPSLIRLLSLPQVVTITKAVDLKYDYANIFSTGRMIADIRPIFDSDAEHIVGAVIACTLRLSYHNSEGSHSLSIAMDSKDVHAMRAECERALKKSATALQQVTSRLDIPATISGDDDDAD